MTKKQLSIAGILIFSSTVLFPASQARAETTSVNTGNTSERFEYDYPELSVVPRASDRLHLEADKEADRRFTTFIPIQVSALSTAVAGFSALGTTNIAPGAIAVGVGLTWLVTSTVFALNYTPYTSSYKRINPMPKSNTREQLTRERAAEEEIRVASDIGHKINWLSFISNFAASAYMVSQFNTGPLMSDGTRGLEFASLALSFVPLIFQFHWFEVQETQSDYKKRIYSPIAMATVLQNPASNSLVPGMLFQLNF